MSIDRLTYPAALAVMALTPCVVFMVIASYAWWLHRAPVRRTVRRQASTAWPNLDVIVPVFNESKLLAAKLANVTALRYARDRVRIIVVDGGSTDGSRQIAEAWAQTNERAVVVATDHPSKAAQLNLALRHAAGSWVVVTDADADMPPNTLQALMRAGRDSGIGAIGSPVIPRNTHPVEQLYWRGLNWLRVREWRRGSASMVVGPCYAFRRRLIDRIPEDVISDDVHVAWRVASSGSAVGFAGPVVHEVRETRTFGGLFRQKIRRGSGIVREVFRFLPRVGTMSSPFSRGFLVRAGLVLLGPPLVASSIGLAVLAGSWLLDSSPAPLLSLGLILAAAILPAPVRRPLALGAIVPLAAAVALMMYAVSWRQRGQGATVSMKRGKRRPAYSP